jgi:hypothetical protein
LPAKPGPAFLAPIDKQQTTWKPARPKFGPQPFHDDEFTSRCSYSTPIRTRNSCIRDIPSTEDSRPSPDAHIYASCSQITTTSTTLRDKTAQAVKTADTWRCLIISPDPRPHSSSPPDLLSTHSAPFQAAAPTLPFSRPFPSALHHRLFFCHQSQRPPGLLLFFHRATSSTFHPSISLALVASTTRQPGSPRDIGLPLSLIIRDAPPPQFSFRHPSNPASGLQRARPPAATPSPYDTP